MAAMEAAEDVIDGSASSQEKIFVSVRVRPLNERESFNHDESDWECINDNTIIYKNTNVSVTERSMYPSAYTFDRVFGVDCSTRQVYEQGAKEVALAVVRGINSSVFAYGQTSSGKTYTMTGITRYSIEDIYEYIQKHKEREFMVKFSAMEIYNESVRDLLSADATPLRLLDDPERGTVVEKLIEETVRDRNHFIELLSICEAQRQIGETFLNENSSRSHQIIRLAIESSAREFLGKDNFSTLTATVDFVDLAGSERASQSLSVGTRLKEGSHINRSLLTLGTVIRKLSKGRSGHIPYRDSKLTRILQPSLGGNAKTAIICTMSPARIHVEQSRNTLLFASCAKEVTISAQVNVVMSDKALVKHLQRELARLESEFRSPGSTSVGADHYALLREKDLQIEKLENEVKDLILQRDIAQSQLREVLQILGDDGQSVLEVGLGHYPNLRVQRSPESERNRRPAARYPLELDVRSCSSGHSRSSSDDHIIRARNFEDNFLHDSTPPRLVIGHSNYSESDSSQGWDDIDQQSTGTSEDLCKEVRCIEKEECSSKESVESNHLSHEESIKFPQLRVLGHEDKEVQESELCIFRKEGDSESPKVIEDIQLESVSVKESQNKDSSSFIERNLEFYLTEGENEVSCVHSDDASSHAKFSPLQELSNHQSDSLSNTLTKSESYKGRVDPLPPQNENKEKDADSVLKVSEISDALVRELPPFTTFSNDVEMKLPGKGSHSSTNSAVDIKLEVSNSKSSCYEDSDNNNAHLELKEKYELQPEKEVIEDLGKEKDDKANLPTKIFKNVGLDPIEDEYRNLQSWPSEFKRLQKDIIELWQACHVSLVHRTYFFLLFQGDPTDAIYMEVELRRLRYLKDIFSQGDKAVVRGQTMTLDSSKKTLRQERRMLCKQMLKKLYDHERDMLFLKWKIGLDTKLRRLQLANLLWTSTEDMNHINDSAYLVAKLVGFITPDQAPKELFSLDFAPRFSKRSYSFKQGLLSLL